MTQPHSGTPDAMLDATKRRCRRAASQDRFNILTEDYAGRPGVSRGRMFGSDGLRVNGKFFAFIGGEGQLIVKLPEAQAEGIVGAGHARPVRAGRATTREWVGIPAQPDPSRDDRWATPISDAHDYVASLTKPLKKPR